MSKLDISEIEQIPNDDEEYEIDLDSDLETELMIPED